MGVTVPSGVNNPKRNRALVWWPKNGARARWREAAIDDIALGSSPAHAGGERAIGGDGTRLLGDRQHAPVQLLAMAPPVPGHEQRQPAPPPDDRLAQHQCVLALVRRERSALGDVGQSGEARSAGPGLNPTSGARRARARGSIRPGPGHDAWGERDVKSLRRGQRLPAVNRDRQQREPAFTEEQHRVSDSGGPRTVGPFGHLAAGFGQPRPGLGSGDGPINMGLPVWPQPRSSSSVELKPTAVGWVRDVQRPRNRSTVARPSAGCLWS